MKKTRQHHTAIASAATANPLNRQHEAQLHRHHALMTMKQSAISSDDGNTNS